MSATLQRWIAQLVTREGTVLHLVPGRAPLARVDGSLEPLEEQPVTEASLAEARAAICGEREAGVLHTTAGGAQMLHGRVIADAGRDTLVVRRLITPVIDRETVGLPDIIWDTIAGLKGGLVLVAGEPDSGASTTCAALAAARTTDAGIHALITGEPLHWRLPASDDRARVTHHIAGVDSDVANIFDFEGAAASLADVDVICCDPVINPYSAGQLTEAATQGPLVIASVNASSAPDAVNGWTAVLDAEARQSVLRHTSRALRLLIHQALVDRADGDGRVLACGVLLQTPAVHNLIREDRAHQLNAMMMVGAKVGMRSLEQDLETLVKGGMVTREAALEAHPHPWMLRDFLDRAGQDPAPPSQP